MQRIRQGPKKNLNRQSRLSITALPSVSLIKGLRDGDIDLDENQPESFLNFKFQMENVVRKSLIGSKIMFKNVHDFISQPTFISLFFAKISNLPMPEYRIQSKIYLRQNDMEDFLENRYVMHALSLVPNKCKDSISASNLVNKNSVAIYQILAAIISFAEYDQLENDVYMNIKILDESTGDIEVKRSYITIGEEDLVRELKHVDYLEFCKRFTDDREALKKECTSAFFEIFNTIGLKYPYFEIMSDLHSGEIPIILLSYKCCVFVPYCYYYRNLNLTNKENIEKNSKFVKKNWKLALRMFKLLTSEKYKIPVLNLRLLSDNRDDSILCFAYLYSKIPDFAAANSIEVPIEKLYDEESAISEEDNPDEAHKAEIVATNSDSQTIFVQKANQEGLVEPESLKSRSESIKERLQVIHSGSIIAEEDEEETDDGSKSESTIVLADSEIEKFTDKIDSTADEIDDDKDEKSDPKPNGDLVDPEKLISSPLENELSKGGENEEKSDPKPNEDLVDSEKPISSPQDDESSRDNDESDRKSEKDQQDENDLAELENQPDDLEEISEKEENKGKQSSDLFDLSEEQEINDDCIDSNDQIIVDEEENDTHISMKDGEVRDRNEDDLDLLISNVEVGDLEEDDNFWDFV